MKEDARILQQIDDEYAQWYEYVANRRQQYRKRLEKYLEQRKDEDKINIHLVAKAIDTLISTSYTDKPKVKFISRDGTWISQERANNLNYIAEFDMDEADYEQINYQMMQDKFFYGVGIRLRTGWDDVKKVPIFDVINPLDFIPDPYATMNGKFGSQDYRYFGFARTATMYDLIDDEIYDEEWLNTMIADHFSPETNQTRNSYDHKGNYNTNIGDLKENFTVWLYYHYTIIDGDRYKIVTDADRKVILQQTKLQEILKEEKKSKCQVRRPLVLNYYKPQRNDFFWQSITDEVSDLERAKSQLFNLTMIKSKKAALGGTYLVNSRLIENVQDLAEPSTWPRFIPTNDDVQDQNLGNAIAEVPQEGINNSTMNGMQLVDREAAYNTGLDAQQLWMRSNGSITATEAQTIQANSNLQMLKLNRIDMWGEKDFWKEWYKGYVANMSQAQQKMIVLQWDFEWDPSTYFQKDDFVLENDPYVKLVRKGEVDSFTEKQRQMLSVQVPMIMQSPDIPKAGKLMAQRLMYKANGFTPNQIHQLLPETHHERQAKQAIKIINAEEKPKALFKGLTPQNAQEALTTYYIYIQQADDNDIKREVLLAIRNALTKLGYNMQSMQQGSMNKVMNSNATMALNKAMQKWPEGWTQNLITRDDVSSNADWNE